MSTFTVLVRRAAASIALTTAGGSLLLVASGAGLAVAATGQPRTAAPPQVTGITPEDGLVAGGGRITITGSDFTGAPAVMFGTKRATSVKLLAGTEIRATIPAGTGRVNVTVTTSVGGTSATSPSDRYTYLAKGSLLTWGNNNYGQLGNGRDSNATLPVAAQLPTRAVVTATARGMYTSYALTASGAVYAWGYGADGELGNGTMDSSALPVRVSFPAGTVVTAIAAGGAEGYALTSTGAVLAWGYGADGELGDGSTSSSDVPVAVSLPPGTKVTQVSAEQYGGLVLTSSGAILAWGYGADGELGDGSVGNSEVPVAVQLPAGTTVSSIAGGTYNGYAVTSTGRELAWGYNAFGELGTGTTTDSDVPVAVSLPAGTRVIAAAGSENTSYALVRGGHVFAWGYGGEGALGNGTEDGNSDVPVLVSLPAGTSITALSAETLSVLARTATGTLLGWGYNYYGDLGDGSAAITSDVPVPVKLPAGVSVVGLGPSFDDGDGAIVSPVTVVTGLTPRRGRAGSRVTISGLNFTGASKVRFGAMEARFTVLSATRITAVVPRGRGTVAVRVTTSLGPSATSPADRFSYRG